MSRNPKNKANTSVLMRQGPPDYTKLSTDPDPTPQADEAGAILEESDTGSRYRWTGSAFVQIGVDGAVATMPSDFFLEVSRGKVMGHSVRNISASNPQVSLTVEDLWDAGGILVYPVAGEQWELSSSSASDTAAGIGARSIEINYLDTSYVRQTETVILNGLTPVTTVATNMFRLDSLEVASVGSTAENVGLISLKVLGAGADRGAILATENISLDGHYTVPAGKTAFIIAVFEEINKNEDIVLKYKATRGTNGIFRRLFRSSIYQNSSSLQLKVMTDPLAEKTDFKITGISSNTIAVPSVIVQIVEINN